MSNDQMYGERARLVLDAFRDGLTLDRLVRLMKDRSAQWPKLSSLYFVGADRDHPFFMRTDRMAIGLSVLPEDEPKSSTPKRHPHQHEVVFVLDGSLRVEILKKGRWHTNDLAAGQVKTIYPNECHRIVSGGQQAVFLFVKTLPAEEPRELTCSENG